MAEIVTLTAAVVKTRSTVSIDRLILDRAAGSVTVEWSTNAGEAFRAHYPTPAKLNPLGVLQPTGTALITTLNSANLTSNSLIKRTLTRLQTDGYIAAGAIGGSPD